MKKLLIFCCFLPLFAGAQATIDCSKYIQNLELSDGTYRYTSTHEIAMNMDGDMMQRMGLSVEMENYRRSFRIHLRTLQGASYVGNARNLVFVFGDNSAMTYPWEVKRDNGEWIAEFAGREPEAELMRALQSKPLIAIRLVPAVEMNERHSVRIPERYMEEFMLTMNCIAGLLR